VERERFLDAVTIWILEHLVEWHCLMRSCGEYNAAELRRPSRKPFRAHTPDTHDGSADDKAFSRFRSATQRILPILGITRGAAEGRRGGREGSGRDATLARRSRVPGAILLMRARGCQMAYIFSDSGGRELEKREKDRTASTV